MRRRTLLQTGAVLVGFLLTLVEGGNRVRRLTEIARIDRFATPEDSARQAETMRKMLLAASLLALSPLGVFAISAAARPPKCRWVPIPCPRPNARRHASAWPGWW